MPVSRSGLMEVRKEPRYTNTVTQQKSTPSAGFTDGRPEATLQRQVQDSIKTSHRMDQAIQLRSIINGSAAGGSEQVVQKQAANDTGLPDNLKAGIENLSGHSMDDVKVHYNSPKPAQLQAHAFAQGTDIHIAPGQQKHLPHEAWHVVQQKQGRVRPTVQMKGKVAINDDSGLEREADVMGSRALGMGSLGSRIGTLPAKTGISHEVIQNKYYNAETNTILDRPEETEAIANAKKEEKEKSVREGYPIDRFTAHHKYPWNKIKEDIEAAFYAPMNKTSTKALRNLEEFSGHTLPMTQVSFLKTVDHRKTTYERKTSAIDRWIQEVCWVPGNIFIGPLSDKRIDDPSKRQGDNDFDGHYTRKRRMSFRSEKLFNIYNSGGLKESLDTSIRDNSVAGYNQEEWETQGMSEGNELQDSLYSQKNDPYFEEHVFPFSITTADVNIKNHTQENFTFEVKTPENTEMKKVGYTKQYKGPEDDVNLTVTPRKTKTENGFNFFAITVPTPSKYILKNFKAGMVKETGQRKVVELQGVHIIRN